MIHVGYSTKINKGHISFNGDNFNKIHALVKKNKLKYNKTFTRWEGSPYIVCNLLPHIQDIEDYTHDKLDLLLSKKFDFGYKDTEFARIKFNKDLLRVPPIIGKNPYEDFQINAVKKGINQNRLALYLGMGTGKTYILTNIINHLWFGKKIDKLLIVAPPEGVVNWRRELLKFSEYFPKKTICISSAKENRDFLKTRYKVVIMTYRHFLTLSDDYHNQIKKDGVKKYKKPPIPFENWGRNRCLILDESHNIKNLKARQSYIIHLHKKFFHYRYIATGTPIPNNFSEIYSQIKFLDESILPPYYEWIHDIAEVGNKYSQYAIGKFYPGAVKKWEDIFSPWVIRLKSNDILNLPDLYVKKIYVELSSKQDEIYKRLINHVIYVIKKEHGGRLVPKIMLNRFPYISQALDNPCLLKDKIVKGKFQSAIDKFKFIDNKKVDIVKSLVDKYINEGRKIIIFDYHPMTMDMLEEVFKKYKPIVIHGQSKIPDRCTKEYWRDQRLGLFKKSSEHNLLIGSSKILSTSINLQEATVAIYFSRDYSFLSWDQSQKRLHRIGQTEPVIIHPIIFEDSLDERLDRILERKKDLDENIFQKDGLEQEEWRKIFLGKEQ